MVKFIELTPTNAGDKEIFNVDYIVDVTSVYDTDSDTRKSVLTMRYYNQFKTMYIEENYDEIKKILIG